MGLLRRTDRDALAGPRATPLVRGRHTLVQGARLSIGIGGIVGGALLLATNVAMTLTTTTASVPWLPLSANLALVFGSAMFLREFQKGRQSSRGHTS